MILAPEFLKAKYNITFEDNDTFRIKATDLRELVTDLADSFGQLSGPPVVVIDLLQLTEAEMDEVIALAYTDCDADPADSPNWSRVRMEFDAIDPTDGVSYHYYCGYPTYVPGAGAARVKPAWHRVEKLCNNAAPTPQLAASVDAQRATTLSGLAAGAAITDYEYQFRPASPVSAQRVIDLSQTLAAGESAADYEYQVR